MSKSTDFTNRTSASDRLQQNNKPLSVLNDGDMELFQQLVCAAIRTDTLLGKAVPFLEADVYEDCDIIEDVPAVMSELYLSNLRISALLALLDDIVPIPEVLETLAAAKVLQADAQEALAELEGIFEDFCGPAEEDETAGDSGFGAEEDSDQEHLCQISIAFPENIDPVAAYEISVRTNAFANKLLYDYLSSAENDAVPCSSDKPDDTSGEEVLLDLGKLSSKELLGLQRLITQELSDRV